MTVVPVIKRVGELMLDLMVEHTGSMYRTIAQVLDLAQGRPGSEASVE